MRIEDWSIDKIMQLPDCLFGRRWPIITSRAIAADAQDQWLVQQPLPDRCVLWSINGAWSTVSGTDDWVNFALGDHEPANAAEFLAFKKLFAGDYDQPTPGLGIYVRGYAPLSIPMRMPILAQSMRFAVQHQNSSASAAITVQYCFEISSIPKEVPDWLILDSGKNLL